MTGLGDGSYEAVRNPSCVCDLRLPCGPCMKAERVEEARRATFCAAPRRYRNTEGLRGHANARKRADS